jgi:endonuclease/exonuclease/phosphatase family metal-dependent hydrolase
VAGPPTPGERPERGGAFNLRGLETLVPDRRERPAERRLDELVVLSWNLFHGRDAPPDPTLHTLRSRLLRKTEQNGSHIQVNRSLREEFLELLATARWTVCLLQECPPGWAGHAAEHSQAAVYRALTSRNWISPVRRTLARHNPDLMGSWEGGSNVILARPPWRIVEATSVLLNPLRERRLHERRRLALTRLVDRDREVCVGNLHLSGAPGQAAREAAKAAELALEWARGAPLVLGGDFNIRPKASTVFDDLCDRAGLCGATDPDALDHILARDLEPAGPPARWAPEQRELMVLAGLERKRLRLSDHAPVEAHFRLR